MLNCSLLICYNLMPNLDSYFWCLAKLFALLANFNCCVEFTEIKSAKPLLLPTRGNVCPKEKFQRYLNFKFVSNSY